MQALRYLELARENDDSALAYLRRFHVISEENGAILASAARELGLIPTVSQSGSLQVKCVPCGHVFRRNKGRFSLERMRAHVCPDRQDGRSRAGDRTADSLDGISRNPAVYGPFEPATDLTEFLDLAKAGLYSEAAAVLWEHPIADPFVLAGLPAKAINSGIAAGCLRLARAARRGFIPLRHPSGEIDPDAASCGSCGQIYHVMNLRVISRHHNHDCRRTMLARSRACPKCHGKGWLENKPRGRPKKS